MSMVKNQVYFDAEQQKFLIKLAKQEHVSVPDLIKNTMERYINLFKIASASKPQKPLSIIGIGANGLTDVSENHDKYVGEGIAKEHNIR